MSRLESVERAARALLEPPDLPFWAPAPGPEPLDPVLSDLLCELAPGEWQRDLALALALRRNWHQRQAYVRAALTRGGLPDLLERVALAETGWPSLRLRLLAGLWRAAPVSLPPLDMSSRVRAAVASALAYLDPETRLPAEAWEVPRLSQPPEVGEGVVFPAAMIAEALQVAGQKPTPLLRELIRRWTPLGWSFWNPEFLPPDTDTLGQVLQVLARSLEPRELERLTSGPAALAAAHVGEDGAVPVFLADGTTWSRKAADSFWPVRHCPAVTANLLSGLYALDSDGFAAEIERGARWLLAWRAETGGWEGPSYVPPYGRYVACRLLTQLAGHVPKAMDREIRERLDQERAATLSSQQWDGSWGSPQATALNLSTLLTLGEGGTAADAAALSLTEAQQHMGCWRSEPLWLTPGPGVYPATFYESVPVTTALCLRALARWEASRRS